MERCKRCKRYGISVWLNIILLGLLLTGCASQDELEGYDCGKPVEQVDLGVVSVVASVCVPLAADSDSY